MKSKKGPWCKAVNDLGSLPTCSHSLCFLYPLGLISSTSLGTSRFTFILYTLSFRQKLYIRNLTPEGKVKWVLGKLLSPLGDSKAEAIQTPGSTTDIRGTVRT